MKKFNITGICRPAKHYMADVSKKIDRVFKMVEEGDYFIINRPRQYGKTTTLYTLSDKLHKTGEYIVFNISFEGISDKNFEDEEIFVPNFVELLAKSIRTSYPDVSNTLLDLAPSIKNFSLLSNFITDFTEKTDKKVVLLIDEVDKSSNNQLFIGFLGLLRNKFLAQDLAKTFHSIILAGLHDVKSLKLKLRPDEEQKYNSPWNIAADFNVNMNLLPDEIKPMLEEYARDKNIQLDADLISERLFYYTSGYPFLVSKLCKMIDEIILPEIEKQTWTILDVELAVEELVREHNTNFDSLIKNLENNPDLYQLVYKKLVNAEYVNYSIHDPIISKGLMYGIFKNGQGLTIHNRIYEEVIYDYMISKTNSHIVLGDNANKNFYRSGNQLNIELILLKFQAFMREHYSKKDHDFVEREGRLVFLTFLKPILNGVGHFFNEVQISEERRLDVTITYYEHKYVAELKVWRGEKAHQEGLEQLTDYLNRLALDEGYLLIFDPSKKKTWKSGWQAVEDKKIFMVWV